MKTKPSELHTIITSSSAKEDLFRSISLPGERWKQVKGFSSNYFVSDMGRLLTLTHRGGKRPSVMKPAKDANGYYRTVLNGKTVKVHRIVAENWLSNPLGLPCVNHIDSNRENNRVENLEWCSVKYNAWYGTHRGRIKVARHPRQDIIPESVRKSVTKEVQKHFSMVPKDRRGHPRPGPNDTLEMFFTKLVKKYPELSKIKVRTVRSWVQGTSHRSSSVRQSLTIPSVSKEHHTHIVLDENIVFPCITRERHTSRARQ